MKRVDISSDKSPNFIGCWHLDDENISKGIIEFFENNQLIQILCPLMAECLHQQQNLLDYSVIVYLNLEEQLK